MAIIRGYFIDIKYSIEDKVIIHLLCRDENGNLFTIRDYYRPNFLIYPKKNIDSIQLRAKIARLRFNDNNYVTATEITKRYINCNNEEFIQVFVSRPETISLVRDTIKNWENIINYFEDDISLTRRYILESRLIPFSVFEAEVLDHKTEGYYKLMNFKAMDIATAKPNILSLCLAYDEETKAISAISCSTEGEDKIITWKKTKFSDKINPVSSEYELLLSLKHYIQEKKPDLLLFEDTSFKLKDIIERARKYKIQMNINIDGTEPHLNYLSNKIRTVGINEVYLRRIIENFIDFSLAEKNLDYIYNTISGVVNISTIASEDTEDNQLINLIHKKSSLNYLLLSSLITNLTELFRLVGLRAAEVLNFSLGSVIEWMLIKQCLNMKQVSLNKHKFDDENKYKMPVRKYQPVIDPVSGIYENIGVIDLTPIYPEIIIKNKLSPDTLTCTNSEKHSSEQGVLPTILSDILSKIERIEMALEKTQNDNLIRRKNMLLRILNHFYEYLNTPYSRWYSHEILETINNCANKTINLIIKKINEKNSVVFSDYHELYIEMNQESNEIVQEIRDMFPEAVRINIKTIYKRGLFLPRDDIKNTRKRFALLNEKGTVESNNIIKHTHPKFVKDTLNEIMKSMLIKQSKTQIIELIRSKITLLNKKEVSNEELIINSKLIKNIEEYNDKTIQHSIIKSLEIKGINVKRGDLIRYIITSGTESVSKRAKLPENIKDNEYDEHHYIHRMLIPAIEDLLPLKGILIEEILEPKTQAQLNKFI
jgi:DNA polymerase elongation subunit (family B)